MLTRRKPYLNETLFQSILNQLKSGVIKSGDLLPSEKSLCEEYSMSRISVRKALNDLAMANLIVKKAGKGSFIRDDIKLSFPAQTGILGCLFCRSDFDILAKGEFYGNIILGIQEAAMKRQRSVIMEDYSSQIASDAYFLQKKYERVDGLIILGLHNMEPLNSLKSINIAKPICVIDFEHPENPFNSVNSENEKGGYSAAKHLIELGHRNIAFIGWKPFEPNILLREKGYRKALAEYNIPSDAGLIYYFNKTPRENIFAEIKKLLHKRKDITAFVCANDGMCAFSAMRAIKESGLRVPDDISVAGYDDLESSSVCVPSLTTLGFNKRLMGNKAVEIVLDDTNAGLNTVIKTELIIRNSTASPRRKIVG